MQRAAATIVVLLVTAGCSTTKPKPKDPEPRDAAAFTPSTCPKGTRWNGLDCEREDDDPATRTRKPVVAPKAPFDFTRARDARAIRQSPRETRLVAADAMRLLNTIPVFPPKDPGIAPVLLSLAEASEELEFALERDAAAKGKAIEPKDLEAARRDALDAYKRLEREYPKFCRQGTSGCLDESLFWKGMLEERLGERDKARKSWLTLVSNHPQSKLVPHAYFSFGVLFHDEARDDPARWALVTQSALKAREYGEPALAEGIARMLADSYRGEGDTMRAGEEEARAEKLARERR